MDDILIRSRMQMPVITGTPSIGRQIPAAGEQSGQGSSFLQVLEEQLEKQSEVSFSKHAANRVAERAIDLSNGGVERLGEGVRIAREKGLDDTLIILGNAAFIVNASSGTVITAMGRGDMTGKAITNIQGTVIL